LRGDERARSTAKGPWIVNDVMDESRFDNQKRRKRKGGERWRRAVHAASIRRSEAAGGRVLREAVAAVDGPALGRLEGDLGRLLAVGAGRIVHLAGGSAAEAATAAASGAVAPVFVSHFVQLGPLRVLGGSRRPSRRHRQLRGPPRKPDSPDMYEGERTPGASRARGVRRRQPVRGQKGGGKGRRWERETESGESGEDPAESEIRSASAWRAWGSSRGSRPGALRWA